MNTSRFIHITLGSLMLSISLLLISEVLLRSLFNVSLNWSYELARILMIWMVYIGAVELTYRRKHINITLLEDRFPVLKRITHALTLITLLSIGVISISFLNIVIPFAQTSPTTNLPTWINYIIIPVVFFAMLRNPSSKK